MRWGMALLALTALHGLTACAAGWQTVKPGGFVFSAPATLKHSAGGTDSNAGNLQDASLRISYDFGAYSDPLTSVEGASGLTQRPGTVGGLAARFVNFARPVAGGGTEVCEAVHVPRVRDSGLGGSIKLTLVLCGDAKATRAAADKVFASIQFTAPAAP
jgi:hypothetical protein